MKTWGRGTCPRWSPNQFLHLALCLHGSGTVVCGVAYFGMGAYKRDVVIVITIGAYIHGAYFV